MRTTGTPTGEERSFDPDEVIVSKTDLQGRITYVNDVFLRVSRYREEDVLGRPHNLIRHPDMPRAVFALLWDEIQSGREVFAYVNNLAADGANYWVLAHVTPTRLGGATVGYHSNRRVPDRSAVDAVQGLYGSLLAEERRHDHPTAALSASRALLSARLDEAGCTYDEFVWSITNQEVAA